VSKDFLGFLSRPLNLRTALRRIVFGGVVVAAGLPLPASAASSTQNVATRSPYFSPTIVDRSRKAGKLVLQLVGGFSNSMTAQHRSHRSHSSHRSSSSGTTARPVAPPPPSTSALGVVGARGASSVIGEITTIDRVRRIITVKQSATITKSYAFRDDTKFETTPGIAVRFDEFSEANNGRLPVVTGDRVQVLWRTATDGKTSIATTLKKVR
jgi:hypothetical protein